MWQDAIKLEVSNVGMAFKFLERGEHRSLDPESSRFAGVVSRESIRIMPTHVTLNGLPLMIPMTGIQWRLVLCISLLHDIR